MCPFSFGREEQPSPWKKEFKFGLFETKENGVAELIPKVVDP